MLDWLDNAYGIIMQSPLCIIHHDNRPMYPFPQLWWDLKKIYKQGMEDELVVIVRILLQFYQFPVTLFSFSFTTNNHNDNDNDTSAMSMKKLQSE